MKYCGYGFSSFTRNPGFCFLGGGCYYLEKFLKSPKNALRRVRRLFASVRESIYGQNGRVLVIPPPLILPFATLIILLLHARMLPDWESRQMQNAPFA